ncbi:MAG: 50S ribosomal protein L11 methyltransferase [Bacteroidota bacterium]
MDYYKVSFNPPEGSAEILIALLADIGFDMFEELPPVLLAYIPASTDVSDQSLYSLIGEISEDISGKEYSVEFLPDRNWNEVWESSFQPVVIAEKVVIKAPFHLIDAPIGAIELIIEPKMSFGTGHHATTALMIESMLLHDFKGASVLDMGCGSGVLAILAERLGAKEVLGIDIDDWAVSNSEENILRNGCGFISIRKGNASSLGKDSYDFILANINRNILLMDLRSYSDVLREGGRLFISGFLKDDIEVLSSSAGEFGLRIDSMLERDNWSQIVFIK